MTRYAVIAPNDRPTIPAAPAAKRMHSGVRLRAPRHPADELLLDYLDETQSECPPTVPRPALVSAIAERMNERDE